MSSPIQIAENIYLLDSHFPIPKRTAVYLLVTAKKRLILIDTSVAKSQTIIWQQIRQLGYAPEQLVAIVLTHAHLDHTGAVAQLANGKPITVYGHADCIRHLCQPEKLEAGVRATYGDTIFEQYYGHITPLHKQQTQVIADNETLRIDDINLQALYTPGHAWHHHSYYLAKQGIIFTGDSFGQSYAPFQSITGDFIFPSTPPSQFNPEAMRQSMQRISDTGAKQALLTHYAAIDNLPRCNQLMQKMLRQYLDLGEQVQHQSTVRQTNQWMQLFKNTIADLGFNAKAKEVEKIFNFDTQLSSAGVNLYFKKLKSMPVKPSS